MDNGFLNTVNDYIDIIDKWMPFYKELQWHGPLLTIASDPVFYNT